MRTSIAYCKIIIPIFMIRFTRQLSTKAAIVTKHIVDGVDLFIKRDDLLQINGLSGNKVRKFHELQTIVDQGKQRIVASYGGCQSNAMVALAIIMSKCENGKLLYFCKKIPSFLKANPVGNYATTLRQRGVQLIELTNEDYGRLVALCKDASAFPTQTHLLSQYLPPSLQPTKPDSDFEPDCQESVLWIPQGGAYAGAEAGVAGLVRELAGFTGTQHKWKVFFASGTGATAMFAARHFALLGCTNVEVIALPCASSAEALEADMQALDAATSQHGRIPTVLSDDEDAAFGRPTAARLRVWRRLCTACGLEFDLLYAPRAFQLLLPHLQRLSGGEKTGEGRTGLLYYHCGGVEGNASQLGRYRRLGLLDAV